MSRCFAFIFDRFYSKQLLVFLLFYQIIFLNVVLPGHQRGTITMDGKRRGDMLTLGCCCGTATKSDYSSSSKSAPSKRDREKCAVCHFAAGVLHTPSMQFPIAFLGLLERVSASDKTKSYYAQTTLAYLGRGPPLS